jgi:serine/threonine protein kinase
VLQAHLSKFMKECAFMKNCTHSNIVPFYGVVVDASPQQEPPYLMIQYIPTGTLADLIHADRYEAMRTDGGCLPFEVQIVALVGLFSALEYLAAIPMIHRDVKPANILVVLEGRDEQQLQLLKVLLADFGEAKQLTQSMTKGCGLSRRLAGVHGPRDARRGGGQKFVYSFSRKFNRKFISL